VSDREKGTVKWFNGAKGYGFIQRTSGEDVFVHFSAIQENGYRTLNEGETVEYDLMTGPKACKPLTSFGLRFHRPERKNQNPPATSGRVLALDRPQSLLQFKYCSTSCGIGRIVVAPVSRPPGQRCAKQVARLIHQQAPEWIGAIASRKAVQHGIRPISAGHGWYMLALLQLGIRFPQPLIGPPKVQVPIPPKRVVPNTFPEESSSGRPIGAVPSLPPGKVCNTE